MATTIASVARLSTRKPNRPLGPPQSVRLSRQQHHNVARARASGVFCVPTLRLTTADLKESFSYATARQSQIWALAVDSHSLECGGCNNSQLSVIQTR